jgi:hypothetical protein
VSDDLFSFAERAAQARAARDAGMAAAEENASPGWGDAMYEFVVMVAQKMPNFTADDVFDLAESHGTLPQQTHDRRAFGPVMMKAARQKICRKANVAAVPSRRISLHASPRTVWNSIIYRGLS